MEGYSDYIPDSLYTRTCGFHSVEEYCNVCNNNVPSLIYKGFVTGPERVYSFCPFGKGESMNKDIFADQKSLKTPVNTTWGRVPQLTPRSLSRIGLDWKN